MSAADRWSVELSIGEHEGETRADARLVMDNTLTCRVTAQRAATLATRTSWKLARRSRWHAPCLTWRTCFSAVLPHRSRTSLTSGRNCTCDPVCVPATRSRWALRPPARLPGERTLPAPRSASSSAPCSTAACRAGGDHARHGTWSDRRSSLAALGRCRGMKGIPCVCGAGVRASAGRLRPRVRRSSGRSCRSRSPVRGAAAGDGARAWLLATMSRSPIPAVLRCGWHPPPLRAANARVRAAHAAPARVCGSRVSGLVLSASHNDIVHPLLSCPPCEAAVLP